MSLWEGGRWVCSSEFVSIYKKHSWLNMSVLYGFLFIKSCFLWLGLWKRTVTFKSYAGEWSHLASAGKSSSFRVLPQWSLLFQSHLPKMMLIPALNTFWEQLRAFYHCSSQCDADTLLMSSTLHRACQSSCSSPNWVLKRHQAVSKP